MRGGDPPNLSGVIYLIRHASAGHRTDRPDDFDRPLDAIGHTQAAEIVVELGNVELASVWSSPARRCTQTVTPLASHNGLWVVPISDLAEGTDIDHTWAALERTIGLGGNVALCSHGDIIPAILRRAELRGMEISGSGGCAKGSIWAIEWADDMPVRGTYLPPRTRRRDITSSASNATTDITGTSDSRAAATSGRTEQFA